MFFAGILAGILVTASLLFLLVQLLPTSPDPSIMTGQTWFVEGVGFVTITKVLHTGSFKEYGVGVNVQYRLPNGNMGHTTSKSLLENGKITNNTQKQIAVQKHEVKATSKKIYSVYNKDGKTRIVDVGFRSIK